MLGAVYIIKLMKLLMHKHNHPLKVNLKVNLKVKFRGTRRDMEMKRVFQVMVLLKLYQRLGDVFPVANVNHQGIQGLVGVN